MSILTGSSSGLTESNYRYLQDFIRRESGIVLDSDKLYLLEARLSPLVRETDHASLNALCDALRGRPPAKLCQRVVDALTTNETLWFREPVHYEALRRSILPAIGKNRQVRFWSAASSSGQELYSAAITLLEMGYAPHQVRLLGTDLSTQMLDRAREGKYLQLEVNRGLPAPLLVKYFERQNLDWRLKDEVRRMAEFTHFDLRQPATKLGVFDIVFCRNVLIYFDPATKMQILSEIAKVMTPDGYLFLGGAETMWGLEVPFERQQIAGAVVYRPTGGTASRGGGWND